MDKCQQCKQNEATVTMQIVINGDMNVKYLCESCHSEIQIDLPEMMSGAGMSDMPEVILNMIRDVIEERNPQGDDTSSGEDSKSSSPKRPARGRGNALDQLARNLNDMAKDGKIDPVIGRDKEIDQVIEVLLRRGKNNPVLIGEGGVGKSAIAEGLALRLVEGDVPEQLRGREIYSLDVSRITEGTGIAGSLEAKLHRIVQEAQEQGVILFIDEIHQIVGTGAHGGTMDIANMLKPALARGELQVFGATTLKEYRIIERDPALERRFQPIQVLEPSSEDTIEILKGLKSHYETFHNVTYTDDALEAAVTLSKRYIADRQLPDKAIDLINAAGARLNLNVYKHGERGKVLIEKQKHEAVYHQDFEEAARLREQEKEIEKQLESQVPVRMITSELIEEILEEMTRIPVRKLQSGEQEKVKNLKTHLSQKVIGQSQAVEQVAKAVRRGRVGLNNKTKPVASFLFYGPTGVGKTELARSLAETLFGSKESLIRIDMSEYSERHSISKMIGSPPGYVGHEEAGQLTEKVRRNPYSVILADEIDKAHPEALNIFLQALEDGRMTDSKGRVVSFKDTIVIMTTNAGAQLEAKKQLGFTKEAASEIPQGKAALKGIYRPEFLNRFDSVIRFDALRQEDMLAILDLMLQDVEKMLAEKGKTVSVTPEAKKELVKLGYDAAFGARPLRLVIQEKVIDNIVDALLDNEEIEHFAVKLNNKREIVIR